MQAHSRRVVTPNFVFLLHARSDAVDQPPRLGITASKKLGGAPLRNRAKRLVRDAFRAVRGGWSRGIDVVVIVRHLGQGSRLWDVVSEWSRAERALLTQMKKALTDGVPTARREELKA